MQLRIRFRPLAATLASAALVAGFAAQSVFADARDFTLINNTSITLQSVYVSPASTNDWEEDVMGRDVLSAGDSVDISFHKTQPSTCVYDIKVVGAAGESGFLYGIDLCSTNTVTFSDGSSATPSLI